MNFLPLAIQKRIYFIRGHKVMIDEDLAIVYGVTTKRLNQQVHRNRKRFPENFMFQLTVPETATLRLQNATLSNEPEAGALRLQNATSKHGRGGRRSLPYVFTEHGAIMVSAVLKTDIAIKASIQIAEAFISLRELLATHKDLARKLEDLEKKYDSQFKVVFDAIRALMDKSAVTRPDHSLPPIPKIKGFTAKAK